MSATNEMAGARTLPTFWNIRDWRMGPKLLISFLAVTAIPLILNGFVGISVSRSALLDQAKTNLQSHSRNTSAAIDTYLLAHRDDIVMVSRLPEIVSFAANPGDPARVSRPLALRALAAAAAKTDYESVAVVNTEGVIVLSSAEQDINTSVKFRPYFQEALKGAAYISDPSVSVITNQPAIFFSSPIRDIAGNIVGVARSRLSLGGIWSLVERDKDATGDGTVGILLDENGIRLAHSASMGNREAIQSTLLYRAVAPVPEAAAQAIVTEKRFGVATEKAIQVRPLPEVAAAMAGAGISTFESSADSSMARHFASLTSLTAKPWSYVLMAPLPTFTGSADSMMVQVIVVTVIILLLMGIGVWFMARAITRPIVQITEIADRISLGELDAKIEITRKDEIGELAEAVRRMQASLQAAIERLRARRGG